MATEDKNAQRNKMFTFSNKIDKMYSPCLVSVVRLAYFIVYGGF